MPTSIRITEIDGVYKPREDTYITLRSIDTLGKLKIFERLRPRKLIKIADIGSGTGILGLYLLATLLDYNKNILLISTDLNLKACICTLENSKINNLSAFIDVICSDTVKPIRDSYSFSIVISNPPYLPEDEFCDHTICAGADGRKVIDLVILEFLNRNCEVLILTQSSLSDLDKTISLLKKDRTDIMILAQVHILFEDIVTICALNYMKKDLKMQ